MTATAAQKGSQQDEVTALAGGSDHELGEALAVAHRVAVLVETDPTSLLLIAIRAALEVADARRSDRGARRQAALDVHGGDRAWWIRLAQQHLPAEQLAARRALSRSDPDAARAQRVENSGGIASGAQQKDGE